MACSSPPHVAILLCTRNGARYLPEQLNSYLAQDHPNWSLWVNDDGSSDTTLSLLQRFKQDNPDHRVEVFKGPRQGIGANFLTLMCHSRIPNGIVALSDQDDIWLPSKLSRGVARLSSGGHGRPVLYASAYQHVDDALNPIESAQRPVGGLRFRDALARNRLCGATMMMPVQTLDLVRRIGPRAVPFHDWWLNQLVTGVGGEVIYDPRPSMLYRQHAGNALGANIGFRAILRRLGLLAGGAYEEWRAINHATLEDIWYELDPACFQDLKRTRRGRFYSGASSSTTAAYTSRLKGTILATS